MDLELGMKVRIKNASYESSYLNFQLSRDVKGHFFESAETNNMFILTFHLKGYEAEHIQIGINEDGTIMEICCEKPVEVIVVVGRRLETKGTEAWKLKKRFRIPEGVSLDEIEAVFAEDESLLTVSMPKTVEGIVGTVIEEIEEPYETNPESSLKEAEIVGLRKETDDHRDSLGGPSDPPHSDDLKAERKEERIIEDHPETAKKSDDDQETKQSIVNASSSPGGGMGSDGDEMEPKRDHPESSSGANSAKHEEEEEEEEVGVPKTDEVHEEEHPLPALESEVGKKEEEEEKGKEVREKSSMICAPIIVAGSALLFSLAFIVRYFRSANPTPKPRN